MDLAPTPRFFPTKRGLFEAVDRKPLAMSGHLPNPQQGPESNEAASDIPIPHSPVSQPRTEGRIGASVDVAELEKHLCKT